MALFDGLSGIARGFGVSIPSGKKGYPKTLQASDFSAVTTACITTAYIKIGEYTIPAQQEINVGYGTSKEPDNQGYIYVDCDNNANANYEGMLRIMVANANETRVVKVFEERTDVLSGSQTLRTQKVPLPEKVISGELGRTPREDDRIQLWLKADADGTFSPTWSVINVPVTVYQ